MTYHSNHIEEIIPPKLRPRYQPRRNTQTDCYSRNDYKDEKGCNERMVDLGRNTTLQICDIRGS